MLLVQYLFLVFVFKSSNNNKNGCEAFAAPIETSLDDDDVDDERDVEK